MQILLLFISTKHLRNIWKRYHTNFSRYQKKKIFSNFFCDQQNLILKSDKDIIKKGNHKSTDKSLS